MHSFLKSSPRSQNRRRMPQQNPAQRQEKSQADTQIEVAGTHIVARGSKMVARSSPAAGAGFRGAQRRDDVRISSERRVGGRREWERPLRFSVGGYRCRQGGGAELQLGGRELKQPETGRKETWSRDHSLPHILGVFGIIPAPSKTVPAFLVERFF